MVDLITQNYTQHARFNMIEQQVRPWNVLDQQVLAIMDQLPREDFVPDGYQQLAYTDTEIPLPEGQQMLAPRLVGRFLQALEIQSHHRILEVGTGSGYLTACLAMLGRRVVSIDLYRSLTKAAEQRLAGLHLRNITWLTGNGLDAIPIERGPFRPPYDAIAITGSVQKQQHINTVQQQLRIGGRLIVVIGQSPIMDAVLITRLDEAHFRTEKLFETELMPLEQIPVTQEFVF